MPEYYIRRLGFGRFQVTKFLDSEAPVAIYYLTGGQGYLRCDCPARGPCKHLEMVRAFIKAGEPTPFLYQQETADVG